MKTNDSLVKALADSKVYNEYERAFGQATGLPVALRSVESWHLPHSGKPQENPFCALLATKSRACAACLQVQQELSEKAGAAPQAVTCRAGLVDVAVPVRLGEQLVGFLQTGQVFRKKPTAGQFHRVLKCLEEWGVALESDELRRAYFGTRVISGKELDAVIKLLSIFADHLAVLSNQILMQRQNAEPPVITRAKEYIDQNHSEDLSLGQVAKAVHTSTFYFCKLFKKATGLNFTHYVARVRVEKAKNLLLNPNLRVSEIAYAVGFQSLTHFNRVFKRIVGEAPTRYKLRLTG